MKMDDLLLELEKAGFDILEADTKSQKDEVANSVLGIKARMRAWVDQNQKDLNFYKERACCDPINKWGHTTECLSWRTWKK
jgi:hypothetical protein